MFDARARRTAPGAGALPKSVSSVVDLGAVLPEFFGFGFEALGDGVFGGEVVVGGVFADVFGDAHAAEMGAAHAAEVGGLGAFGGKGFIVVFAGALGIEGEIELVLPAEFEAGFG